MRGYTKVSRNGRLCDSWIWQFPVQIQRVKFL